MKFNYSWGKTRNDLLAAVTVAAISLPQAMACALIAGVDPRFGLYSAIVVTLVASIFGSSSHLINALHLGVRRDRLHGRGRRFGGTNPTGQSDWFARSWDGAAACALPHLAHA
jgi:hypothetical protein